MPPVVPSVAEVSAILENVIDPELGSDIVDLGMVKDIVVTLAPEVAVPDDSVLVAAAPNAPAAKITITIALTTMGCPLRAQIRDEVKQRVADMQGVGEVDVEWSVLTSEEKAETMAKARLRVAQNAKGTAVPMSARVLLVASGKGGVGKSTVTANLATALAAQGFKVGVLDADIWGFSLPRMLGIEGRLEGATSLEDAPAPVDPVLSPAGPVPAGSASTTPPATPVAPASADPSTPAVSATPPPVSAMILPREVTVGEGLLKVVSMGLLVENEETALMWRGLILNRAVRHFLEDVLWGDIDYLIVDLPPGTGDVQMGVAKLLPRAEMLIVTTPSITAQKIATRAANMGRKNYLKVAGVIENMTSFATADGESHSIFGVGGGQALATEVDVPLLAQIPLDAAIAEASDNGVPVTHPSARNSGDSSGASNSGATSPGALAFQELARKLVSEVAPPVNMSGCTARLGGAGSVASMGVDTQTEVAVSIP